MQKVTGTNDTIERMHHAEREATELREENRRLSSDLLRKTERVEELSDQVVRLEREVRDVREKREEALEALAHARQNLERAEEELDR
jgi:hypothetical protein